jgi:hypothetical protein
MNYKPLLRDLFKTATVLFVIEFILFFTKKEPLLDKLFIQRIFYEAIGYIIYYILIDPIIFDEKSLN